MISTARQPSRNPDALGHVFVPNHLNARWLLRMNELVKDGHDAEFCNILSILGPPRCGKTSLVAEFDRRSDLGEGDFRPRRLLEVQVPPRPGLMDLVTAMLNALHDPAADHGTIYAKTGRAIKLLKRGRYDAIIYDEVHRVVAGRTERSGTSAAEWMSDILNMRICPAIGIGEPPFANLLKDKEYLDGRSFGVECVTPCDWSDKDQRFAFRHTVNGICGHLGMPVQSDVIKLQTLRRIAIFSNGRIGYVALLLAAARRLARAEGAPALTADHLRLAVDHLALQSTGPGFNPFNLNEGDPRLVPTLPSAVDPEVEGD